MARGGVEWCIPLSRQLILSCKMENWVSQEEKEKRRERKREREKPLIIGKSCNDQLCKLRELSCTHHREHERKREKKRDWATPRQMWVFGHKLKVQFTVEGLLVIVHLLPSPFVSWHPCVRVNASTGHSKGRGRRKRPAQYQWVSQLNLNTIKVY